MAYNTQRKTEEKEEQMQYTYEFEVFKANGWFIARPFDMDGATQGKDIKEISLMAAEWLRTDIEHRLMHDYVIPEATYGNQPKEDGAIMIVSIEAGKETIQSVSASEAARMLGVTPARVTHLIRDGQLEAFRDGNRTWVFLASVMARINKPVRVGRPRKQKVD